MKDIQCELFDEESCVSCRWEMKLCVGTNKCDHLSEQSGYDSGNGLPEQTLVHITSRETAHFYVKSFSKFNINQSWLWDAFPSISKYTLSSVQLWWIMANVASFPCNCFNFLKGGTIFLFFPSHYFCSVFDSNLTTSSVTMQECSIWHRSQLVAGVETVRQNLWVKVPPVTWLLQVFLTFTHRKSGENWAACKLQSSDFSF